MLLLVRLGVRMHNGVTLSGEDDIFAATTAATPRQARAASLRTASRSSTSPASLPTGVKMGTCTARSRPSTSNCSCKACQGHGGGRGGAGTTARRHALSPAVAFAPLLVISFAHLLQIDQMEAAAAHLVGALVPRQAPSHAEAQVQVGGALLRGARLRLIQRELKGLIPQRLSLARHLELPQRQAAVLHPQLAPRLLVWEEAVRAVPPGAHDRDAQRAGSHWMLNSTCRTQVVSRCAELMVAATSAGGAVSSFACLSQDMCPAATQIDS